MPPKTGPGSSSSSWRPSSISLGDSTEEERDIFKRAVHRAARREDGLLPQGFSPPRGTALGAGRHDGKYLGHLWLSERDNPRHGTRTLQVTTLGIVRDGRGKNYGRLLMHKAEQEAKERGIEVIALEVAETIAAPGPVQDLGYETIRRTMHKRLRAQ